MHDISNMASAILTIDLGALVANWRRLVRETVASAVGAVVKADAYGLGAAEVVPALAEAGCQHFFVAQLEEALAIRSLLPPDARVYVLNGLVPGTEEIGAGQGIVPLLNSPGQARRWQAEAEKRRRPLAAVLQVDSGMSRLGLAKEESIRLATDSGFREAVPLLAIMSHLACADDPSDPANIRQLDVFRRLAVLFPGVPRSLANSGGCLLPPAFHGDIARPGLVLYGVEPARGGHEPFAPVVRLDARVIQTRRLPSGAGVGYGLTWHAREDARVAAVGVGYADGWLRSLSNRGAAWFAGQRLPILGRISMDSFVVDISTLPKEVLSEGDLVELIGPNQTLENVARDAGTIAYEILTGLGHRYARRYIPAGSGTLDAPREIAV